MFKSEKLNPKIPMPERKQPVIFAKSMILELACIRATVQHLAEIVIDDIALRTNKNKIQLRNEFKVRTNAKAKRFYEHYVKEVGLEDKQDGPV